MSFKNGHQKCCHNEIWWRIHYPTATPSKSVIQINRKRSENERYVHSKANTLSSTQKKRTKKKEKWEER